MFLNEIFDQLSDSELSQTNLGTIDTQVKISRVVNHLNLGLADLFKRFFLREGRVMVPLVADQVLYPLNSVQAPLASDLLLIEKVLTAEGFALTLDDGHDKWSLTTTDTRPVTLSVPLDIVNQVSDLPDDLKTTALEVVYRARHPKIDVEAATFDPETYDVLLPDSHLQALLYYVASRVLAPAGMGQTEGVSSAGYWKRYEAECASLTHAGIRLQRTEGFDRLRDRGFA